MTDTNATIATEAESPSKLKSLIEYSKQNAHQVVIGALLVIYLVIPLLAGILDVILSITGLDSMPGWGMVQRYYGFDQLNPEAKALLLFSCTGIVSLGFVAKETFEKLRK